MNLGIEANHKTTVTILYGSDTGNAQDYAIFLSKRLRYLSLNPTVAALDEYPLKRLVTHTKYLIIVCSTAGQGEVPRNGRKFMKFILKRKLPADLFNHLKISTFGIGDSSYPKYNFAIKKIHTRLKQLGCRELSDSCEADEQSEEGVDGFYTVWEQNLIESLESQFPTLYPLRDEAILPPENSCNYAITDLEIDPTIINTISATRSDQELKKGTISSIKRITASSHFQDVKHIIIQSSDLAYSPGDAIGLFPSNDPEDVQSLLNSQKSWSSLADKPLKIQGKLPHIEGGLIDQSYLTLRTLLTHHLDIMAIPTRSFFFSIWHFIDTSTEDGEREQLKIREFYNFEFSEDLYNYANRPRRSILEFLLEFENNLIIPPEYIFDLFPKIKPRLYSIASKPDPETVEIVVGIVEYKTILKRIRKGLCSKWLKTLNPHDQIVFSIHKQGLSFSLPNNPSPPLILVGPGTGIAPMKSLVEHISSTKQQDMHLFFGFRNENMDFMFKDLWDSLVEQGKLHLYPCISRSETQKMQYVQNGLFKHRDLVRELIKNGAILYICGSSGPMPRQVRETIIEILGGDVEYLKEMENSGRYIQETW